MRELAGDTRELITVSCPLGDWTKVYPIHGHHERNRARTRLDNHLSRVHGLRGREKALLVGSSWMARVIREVPT